MFRHFGLHWVDYNNDFLVYSDSNYTWAVYREAAEDYAELQLWGGYTDDFCRSVEAISDRDLLYNLAVGFALPGIHAAGNSTFVSVDD